jgi:hypothetical protein
MTSGIVEEENFAYRSDRRFTEFGPLGKRLPLRLRTGSKVTIANGISIRVSTLNVMGRRILSESKNNRIQRIRSIAIAFLHSLICPRRRN